jgi:dihydrofolate reductase
MGMLTVIENLSLDGVAQAPGGAEEDTRGGFAHGGWARRYDDAVLGAKMGEGMAKEGALLFGRRTFEQFASFWPHQTDNPFTPVLNASKKYVATRGGSEQPEWENSVLLVGEAADTVGALKKESAEDLAVIGSAELVRALFAAELVDRLQLIIHPLVLGSGTRLFPQTGPVGELRLLECTPTTTGSLIALYAI